MKYISIILLILCTFSVKGQTVIKNRITVDSTFFEGRGISSDPLTLKLDSINSLISDSIATVGGGTLPYYELVATYVTDGTGTDHTFVVTSNTFPATTWTAEDMPSGGIILHPSVLTYADYANQAKIILVGGSTYNLLGYSVYCAAANGSTPATDGLMITPVKGDTGAAAAAADLEGALLLTPLTIILRYYY